MKSLVRILVVAFLFGGLAFAVGFFGPLFLTPDNNLSPLFGIFIAGPIGVFAGAALGVLWSAIKVEGPVGFFESIAILISFFFAFLGCYWWANSLHTAYVASIGLAIFVVMVSLLILSISSLRQKLSRSLRINWTIVLVAVSLMVLIAIFPPAMTPKWVQVDRLPAEIANGGTPPFVYILDNRLDASTSYPELAVDVSKLTLQWVVVVATAFALAILLELWRRKERNEQRS